MEDVNDDFGELYADVEFQASSAINGVPDISQLCVRQQQQEEQQPLSNELSNDSSDALDSADDGSGLGNDERREKDLDRGNDGESEVVVESGSDSDDEDDFDVVVNDDDVGANNGRECRNVGEDDEKEFVAATTEANSMLKNQDRVDGGGVELSVSGYGGEKGHAGKNCWVSQYRVNSA